MKFLPLLILLAFVNLVSSATLTDWVATPNLGSGVDVADYGTDGTYTINLNTDAAIHNLTLADWSGGITSLIISNSGGPHNVTINNLDLAGDYFHVTIANGVTLIVNGTTVTNGGEITVQSGGKIVFDNTVRFADDGLTLNIDNGGFIDINSTLTINGGINNLNVNGNLEVNYLVANGGNQQINTGTTGEIRVIYNASFNSGDAGSASFTVADGGNFLINGDLDVGNTGGVYTVTGVLAVGGTITGNGATRLPSSPPHIYIGAEADSILPIVLNYFHAYNNKTSIILVWQTASEENNNYFTVERAADAINFEVIDTIAGARNSTNILNYSYTDKFPLTGKSYYRLTQTDYDGKSKTFDAVPVTFFNEKSIQFSPMPASNVLNISVDGSMGMASLKIINLLGAFVREINQMDNQNSIDVSALPKGIYIISIEGGGSRYAKQIMIN